MNDSADSSSARSEVLSVVVPAFDEEATIRTVLDELAATLAELPCRSEVIVVDDGSRDQTAARAAEAPGIRLVRNPVNLGYGHSLLRGIAVAQGELIGLIDADLSYPAVGLKDLYQLVCRGADHAIGRRTGQEIKRPRIMRTIYRWLCGYVVGMRVPDANSGLRVFRRDLIENLRGDLCRGFSFTTSFTLASIMSGFVTVFHEIPYRKRVGHSHVRFRDLLRTAQYLFQLIAVYNPIKLFLPLVVVGALLTAAAALLIGLGMLTPASEIAFLLAGLTVGLVGLMALAYIASRIGSRPIPSGPSRHND